jgi:hypothetical protein
MSERAVAVVDINVLLNLATPVVDGRPKAPSGGDPLKALLTVYDVHTPASVLGEVTDAAGSDDLLAAAAELVLQAAHHLTAHDVDDRTDTDGQKNVHTTQEEQAVRRSDRRITRESVSVDFVHQYEKPLDYGLDRGESDCIWLANELEADLFITDEFNTTNYLLVALALDDRNILFTTPHILCTLATDGVLSEEYVGAALTYYAETKGWNVQYVAQLRQHHLEE